MKTPTLDILASSSAGNAYVITAGNERLMIECGVPFREILKVINYEIKSVVGVLISHAHR